MYGVHNTTHGVASIIAPVMRVTVHYCSTQCLVSFLALPRLFVLSSLRADLLACSHLPRYLCAYLVNALLRSFLIVEAMFKFRDRCSSEAVTLLVYTAE